MKKKVISTLLCAAMIATMVVGCGGGNGDCGSSDSGSSSSSSSDDQSSDDSGDGGESNGSGTYTIVTKSAGNPFNEKTAEVFQEVIEAAGGTAIVKHPEAATADA